MRDPDEIDLDGPPASAVETIDDRSGLLDLSDDSGEWQSPGRGVAGSVAAAVVAAVLATLLTAALLG